MRYSKLHQAELSILRTLRRTTSARFSDLMKPTGIQSDSFKFYIRKLIKLEYIEKQHQGDYKLTAKGKEFANNLDDTTLMIQKQPKLSVLIIASNPGDPSLFLFQSRQRHPYYGFYGFISGPVRWGEDLEVAARREFTKQTGLEATFCVKGFYRQKDHDISSDSLLEDKLFAIVEAIPESKRLENIWPGGQNQWMTLDSYTRKEKRFPATDNVLTMLNDNKTYCSYDAYCSPQEY